MKKFFLVIFCSLFSLAVGKACSCEPRSIEEAFRNTPLIIQGKVLTKEYVSYESTMDPNKVNLLKKQLNKTQQFGLFNSKYIIKIELEILKVYKGISEKKTITIFTTRTGASCGFLYFEIGKKFIVYASPKSFAYHPFTKDIKPNYSLEKSNTFWTNQCTRTRGLDKNEILRLDQLHAFHRIKRTYQLRTHQNK